MISGVIGSQANADERAIGRVARDVGGSGPWRARRPVRAAAQRGSGTMLIVGVMALLLMIAGGLSVLGGYAVAGHRARAAADLSALSGATAHQRGGDACASAADLAQRNGASLLSCRVTGLSQFVVTVQVSVTIRPALPGLSDRVVATAYAGSAALAGGG